MKKKNVMGNLNIENAELRFLNFSGAEGKYNPEGKRNFSVILENNEMAERLLSEGWNVRYLQPIDEDEDPAPYIQVNVSFKNRPPKIVLIKGGDKSLLNEENVSLLDWADIESVDLSIRPYQWEVGGRSGIKGYLQSMYVRIYEDPFEHKYRNAPDSAESSVGGCGNCAVCDGSCKHGRHEKKDDGDIPF